TASQVGEPLIISRDRDGKLNAMSAVCRHRAMLVAEGHGNTRGFVCPYHHWTYSLSGDLVGAPQMNKACDFDRTQFPLPKLKLETWLGFVFVTFDLNAPPLAPRLAALADVLKNYNLAGNDELPTPGELRKEMWNWKVRYENSNDGYHANRLHA